MINLKTIIYYNSEILLTGVSHKNINLKKEKTNYGEEI